MAVAAVPAADLDVTSPLDQALARCMAPVAEADCLPPACYHDADVMVRERPSVFRRGWLSIGRADMVREPGDYVTMTIADVPLIVLRDKKGDVRAFANTCRHRGAKLLAGEGMTDLIRCPFHCWTYRLTGELVGGSHMDQTASFDKADYGLIAFPTEVRSGFLFVCLDPEVPDLDQQIGDFVAMHAPWPIGDLVLTRRRELHVDCNWKAFLDVFNEYYHLPYVHPDSLSDLYDPPAPGDPVTGDYATQYGVTEGTGGLLESQQDYALPKIPGLTGKAANGVRYTWLFPNLTFAAGTDALWVYEAYPDGPERCRVIQSVCFPKETMALPDFEAKAEQYYIRMDAALDEDVPALVNQQQGIASPFAQPGRFSVLMEPNVARFAAWYAGRLLAA